MALKGQSHRDSFQQAEQENPLLKPALSIYGSPAFSCLMLNSLFNLLTMRRNRLHSSPVLAEKDRIEKTASPLPEVSFLWEEKTNSTQRRQTKRAIHVPIGGDISKTLRSPRPPGGSHLRPLPLPIRAIRSQPSFPCPAVTAIQKNFSRKFHFKWKGLSASTLLKWKPSGRKWNHVEFPPDIPHASGIRWKNSAPSGTPNHEPTKR